MRDPRNEREAHAEMLRGLDTRPAEEIKAPVRTVNLLMVAAVLTAANRHSANQHRASKRSSRKAMAAGSMTWPMTSRFEAHK